MAVAAFIPACYYRFDVLILLRIDIYFSVMPSDFAGGMLSTSWADF